MARILDQVLKDAPIEEIISFYGVPIQGNKCLCPFHNDTSPSMTINKKDNYVKCFACGEGANSVTFIQKYENKVNKNPISFSQAIIKAVEICNLPIDVSQLVKQQEQAKYHVGRKIYDEYEQNLLSTSDSVSELYQYSLFTNSEKSIAALSYLESRGLSKEMIENLGIGYAPIDTLSNLSQKSPNDYPIEALEQLGLINNGRELFSDRIIFPIADAKGNIVAYGGRTLDPNAPAKYLNTPETTLFQKSEILFNMNNAKNYAYKNNLYIVEGYMDVVGAKAIGLDNTVALMGTALSQSQIEMIQQIQTKPLLALDNDTAGKNATLKHIKAFREKGIEVDVVDYSKLGEYKDFGDVFQDDKSIIDVENATIPSHYFVYEYLYFQDKEISISTIKDSFIKARQDGWITTTSDEQFYIDYITSKSEYLRNEVKETITPQHLDEPTLSDKLKNNLLLVHINQSLQAFLTQRDDEILTSYYELNKKELVIEASKLISSNAEDYLTDSLELNNALVLNNLLAQREDFLTYEKVNRFRFQNALANCYSASNGKVQRVNLSLEQKEVIQKQFEGTIPNNEKLRLNGVEEIYIVDTLNDLNTLLPKELMAGSKELLKESMQLEHRMQYFNYGTILRTEQIPYTNEKYLTKDGQFKTILFFNNLEKALVLEEQNFQVEKPESIVKEEKMVDNHLSPQVEEKEKIKVEISKPYQLSFAKEVVTIKGDFVFLQIENGAIPACIKVNRKNTVESENEILLNSRSDFTYSLYRKETINEEKPAFLRKASVLSIKPRQLELTNEKEVIFNE